MPRRKEEHRLTDVSFFNIYEVLSALSQFLAVQSIRSRYTLPPTLYAMLLDK